MREFQIPWTNFFDDFLTLSPAAEASSITSCVQMFFKLLGWKFADDGPKAPPFVAVFKDLGISVDVSQMQHGAVLFDNTPSRKSDLCESLKRVVLDKTLSRHEALRLRGCMQFASGQMFGRLARFVLGSVTKHAYNPRGTMLSQETVNASELYARMLENGSPRKVTVSKRTEPWFVFMDASHELSPAGVSAGIGGVLINSSEVLCSYFSCAVIREVLMHVQRQLRKTLIFELEFFAVFCALSMWTDIVSPFAVVFIDNNGVKDALVRCGTSSVNASPILKACLTLEDDRGLRVWYARVPTHSCPFAA